MGVDSVLDNALDAEQASEILKSSQRHNAILKDETQETCGQLSTASAITPVNDSIDSEQSSCRHDDHNADHSSSSHHDVETGTGQVWRIHTNSSATSSGLRDTKAKVTELDEEVPSVSGETEIDTLSESSLDGRRETPISGRHCRWRCCCGWPWLCRRIRHCLVGLVVVFLILVAVLFIGGAVERRRMQKKPSTLHLYEGSNVCAVNGDGLSTTFASAMTAHSDGQKVAHCGSCGQCSTIPDMETMGRTKDTLTRDSTLCALRMLWGGRKAVASCMEHKVGFTPSCNDCWVDNIRCTFQSCKFTCLRYKIFGESNNNEHGGLNRCLQCDEQMCGPEFLSCSGANRRRMGVVSDIGRDHDNEQCDQSDFDWESA